MSSGDSGIYSNFSQSSSQSKNDMKEILDQMMGVIIDFSDSYARTQKVFNSPQHQNLKVQQRVGEKIQNWNNEIKNLTMNQRRGLNRLLTDIKYIVGSLPNSERLYEDLELSSKPLRDHWDSHKIGGPNAGKSVRQIEDILRIMDLPLPASTQYVQSSTVVRQNEVVREPSPRPSAVVSQQPQQRVYYIDPVTGQRVEKTSATERYPSPAPQQITSQQISSQQISSQHNTPNRTALPQQPPQVDREKAVYRKNPDGSYTLIEGPPSSQQPGPRPSQTNGQIQQRPAPNPSPSPSRVVAQEQNPNGPPGTQRVIVAENRPPAQPAPQNGAFPQPEPQKPPAATEKVQVISYPPPKPQEAPKPPAPEITKEYDYLSRKQENEDRSRNPSELLKVNDMFDVFREVKVEVDDYPTKIEASQDGNRIYYGGETFGLLEYDREGFLVPHGRIFTNRISDISPILKSPGAAAPGSAQSRFLNGQNGDVMVGELKNWNMHLYDRELQELGRLNSKFGANNRTPPTHPQFKLTSAKPQACLWYSGAQNLSIVDTGSYLNQEINNFWMMRGKAVDPLGAHLSARGDIVGIGRYDGAQNSLHYYNHAAPNTVLAYDRVDIFPYCHSWLCLDGHPQGQVFFVGGSSSPDQKNAVAYLLALSFDENVDVVRYREFPPVTGYNAFQVLKVYPDNMVFVASHKAILIFVWSLDNFVSIKQIDLEYPVHDFVLSTSNQFVRGPVVYALNTNGVCTTYNFGKPQLGSRPIQLKPAVRNNKTYEMGAYMSETSPGKDLIDYNPQTAEKLSADQRQKLKKSSPQFGALFKEFAIKQIAVASEKLGRVQAAPGERAIYCGADVLRELEVKGADFVLLGRPNPVKAFVDLYLIKKTGELVVLDKSTSDLVKYDAAFNELKRLKGEKQVDARIAQFFSTIFVGSDLRFLWVRGDNTLNVVDPQSFACETLPNFFAKQGEKSMPVAVAGSKANDKYIGVYMNDLFQNQIIVFVDKRFGMIRKAAIEINPRVPFNACLENCSKDTGIFFAGGTTNMEIKNGAAVLQAISFDASLMLIDELELKSGNNLNRQMVSALTRTADLDVLYAGVNQAVFVVEWTGTHFCILNYVDEIHSGLVTSIDSLGANIYTSCFPESQLNRIEFKPS